MFNPFIAITLIYKTYISQSIADYGNVCRKIRRLLLQFDIALSSTLFMTAFCDRSRFFIVSLLFKRRFAKEILGIDRPPCRRGRKEFSGESTMARKLANLWPCRRAKSLCGSTEIARARFFSTLNGPRTTIGCCDELFGRTHDRHELFFSLSLSFSFSLSLSLFLLYQSLVSATQFQMRIANRLPFANRPDTWRFCVVPPGNEFFPQID